MIEKKKCLIGFSEECSARVNLRTHCTVVFFLVISSFGQARSPSFSDPSAPPFIVRIQRARSDKNVCAIVRDDGFFHLESETINHFEVSEGTLSSADLTSLKALLSNSDLVALHQNMIAAQLVSEKDEFILSILRSTLMQNLVFKDRESRKPFDSFINPLLHWLDKLEHHAHTSFGEFEGRNNCLPHKEPELSHRRELPPSVDGSSVPSGLAGKNDSLHHGSTTVQTILKQPAFLMRWHVGSFFRGTAQDTCVIVYPSGLFHMEKSSQSYQAKLNLHAFEDILQSADLEQLEGLLNDPRLKSSTHYNLAEGEMFHEAEITTLDIAREARVQKLGFANYFAIHGWAQNISSTDPEEKIVAPLRKWIEYHIKTNKEVPLVNAVPTHCAPQQ